MPDPATTPDAPTRVDVWFDPVCPFTWVTTRWLRDATARRGLETDWHLMSLAALNEGAEQTAEERAEMADSRVAGRLLAAVADRHGPAALEPAYAELGSLLHRAARPMDRDTAAAALAAAQADPDLVGAVDDDAWDPAVRASHQQGQELLGGDGGTPIIAIDRQAFFGPVLMEIPGPAQADALFDAVTVLARTGSFRQIQRPFDGLPDPG